MTAGHRATVTVAAHPGTLHVQQLRGEHHLTGVEPAAELVAGGAARTEDEVDRRGRIDDDHPASRSRPITAAADPTKPGRDRARMRASTCSGGLDAQRACHGSEAGVAPVRSRLWTTS